MSNFLDMAREMHEDATRIRKRNEFEDGSDNYDAWVKSNAMRWSFFQCFKKTNGCSVAFDEAYNDHLAASFGIVKWTTHPPSTD